ncbi:hypothetical protein SPRG_19923 [Saprolegnia parasitica CBS 223.65]|uniref:Uncharacterized protein n=1 Tax=Saprolegnia parasitica (strain CBS 223.65) TaxID=695850 RepID=A0A067CRX4_SAPPC|nr:hypothetical protein SPRG_19923 [Saprolegnia parasitica CBS 223.65]KDO29261.1 hypothetical protein SPRG_19923 [Saprolegnia parasitica CBS 223.65]|eukprot:XP_012200148.1 hypothetical protein SPRG_19923 [Saprolegnia parasitica CBS 223.65]
MQCGGCAKSHDQVYLLCANCTSSTIQQKRTMLTALRADVAVLREKAASSLKDDVHAEPDDDDDVLAQDEARDEAELLALKGALDIERIKLAKMLHMLGKRRDLLAHTKARLAETVPADATDMDFIMQGLYRVSRWNEQNLVAVRRTKVLQLLQLVKVIPADKSAFFRTIMHLPLPISGRFEGLPPDVVAAGLGRIIHLLLVLPKYLSPLVYPYPMVHNGSMSTIGRETSDEGAGCHTLYPDGSLGFGRATQMLQHNVLYLCVSQGMLLSDLHPSDMLGNLVALSEHPELGSCVALESELNALRQQQRTATPRASTNDATLMDHVLPSYAEPSRNQTPVLTASMLDWNVIDPRALPTKRDM